MSGESADPPTDERRSDGDGQPLRPLNEATSRQDVRHHDENRSASDDASVGESTAASDQDAASGRQATAVSGKDAMTTSESDRDAVGGTGETTATDPTTADPEVVGRIAEGGPRVGEDLLPEHSFALCLTHDVDRPYKFAQAAFYALRDRDPRQLLDMLPGRQPNWTFDRLLAIEAELGVRSAFYFLDEQRLFRDRPPRDWFDMEAWQLYADRYSLDDPAIVELMDRLDRGGWEVGLHGSYESYDDRQRLRAEKHHLENVFGQPVLGGRQHYLNRTLPETWEHHAALGLGYDATVGSSSEIGFDYGDTIGRPFDDEFVAFPLTMMDVAMPDPGGDPSEARAACDRILEDAAERGAIATVLWHPRVFNETDWPGHAALYRHLIERAQELGAWVGSPGELYAGLDHPE